MLSSIQCVCLSMKLFDNSEKDFGSGRGRLNEKGKFTGSEPVWKFALMVLPPLLLISKR